MNAPSHVVPTTVAGAVETLLDNPGARVLSGGTDLMVQMRLGHRSPETVVDTMRIEEMHQLDIGDPTIIGAAVTLRTFLSDPTLVARYRALAQASHLLGGRQIQAAATFGGNVCNASPAAETTTPLLVFDAMAEIAGPQGRRQVPLADFFAGPGRTVLADDELLVSLRLPGLGAMTYSAYQRMELRRSVDIAIVSSSACLDIHDGHIVAARVAIGAVNAVATRVPDAEAELVGVNTAEADELREAVARAATACREASQPISDTRASVQYRSAMIEIISRRTITEAIAQETVA